MRVGTCGSAGLAGAAALPSFGDCSLVCSFMATSRSSSRIGGKSAAGLLGSSVNDVVDVSAISVDMKSNVGRCESMEREHCLQCGRFTGDGTKAFVDDTASRRAKENLMLT